ncbi:MAG: HAMP domain-containing histidine kinase [Firmicutes bacterium]|nr:HAMP domain-containing histidine kinase [Bacillota bacterium]
MLRKLRKRFIIITMSLIGAVLLAVTVFACVNIYHAEMSRVERSLDAGLGMFEARGEESNKIGGMGDRNPVVTVYVSPTGDIVRANTNMGYLDDDILEEVAETATFSVKTKGRIKKYKLAFKKEESGYGILIAFASYKEAKSQLQTAYLLAAMLFTGAMLILLLITIQLSKYAFRPAEKAWAQQQQFIADASHELKTPITAILANNNVVLAHGDSTVNEQKKWIENSQAEAQHMKELVNNMLFLAKSEGEEQKTLLTDVSLSDVCQEAVMQFDPVAFENGTLLESEIEDGVVITGDLTQLRQLAYILIDNACKYAGLGGSVDFRLTGGKTPTITVNNTGDPIPPEDLPHIFERFYRSDKARTQKNQAGGYGLGLAIARTIAEKHGAQIKAESDALRGTTFTVTFRGSGK